MRISRDTFTARCRTALGDLPESEPRPLFAWLARLEGLLARPPVERRVGWEPAELQITHTDGTEEIRRVTCNHGDEAEAARANGWEPGTVIVGDEGWGLDAIRIDYLGREILVATHIATIRGDTWAPCRDSERTWMLSCREWRVATPGELAEIEAARGGEPA
jgi:hypothetical protein